MLQFHVCTKCEMEERKASEQRDNEQRVAEVVG